MDRSSAPSAPASMLSVAMVFCATLLPSAAPAYTDKQAEAGQIDFNNHCAECHGPELDGALGPNLHDEAFRKSFANRPVSVLRSYVWQNMPQPTAKSLPDNQLDPIIAWILKKNGVPANGRPVSKTSAKTDRFEVR